MANVKWIVGGALAVGAAYVLTRKKTNVVQPVPEPVPSGPVRVEERAMPTPAQAAAMEPKIITPPPNVPVMPTVPPPPITATPKVQIPAPTTTLAPPPPISPMILNQTATLPPSAINMRDAVLQTIKEPNPRSPEQTFNIAATFSANIRPVATDPRPMSPAVMLAAQAKGNIPSLGTKPIGPPPMAVVPPRIVLPPPKPLPPPVVKPAPVVKMPVKPVLQTGPQTPRATVKIPPLPLPPKVPVSTIPRPPIVPAQPAAQMVARALNLSRKTRSVIF